MTGLYDHSEVFNFRDIKLTFLKLQVEVKLGHALENVTDSFDMGLEVWGGNEEVIHIDDKPSFSDHVSEQVIHESLEHDRGIAKAKEHDCWFKESFVSDEGGPPLVIIFDMNIVVTSMNIKLGEVASIF